MVPATARVLFLFLFVIGTGIPSHAHRTTNSIVVGVA